MDDACLVDSFEWHSQIPKTPFWTTFEIPARDDRDRTLAHHPQNDRFFVATRKGNFYFRVISIVLVVGGGVVEIVGGIRIVPCVPTVVAII